jgi:hypothetical protein
MHNHQLKKINIFHGIYQLSNEPNPFFVCFFSGAGASSGLMEETLVVAECGRFLRYFPISSVAWTVP